MNEKSKELLSEESEDYTLDDIIQLHKVDDETDSQGFVRKVLLKKAQPAGTVNKLFKPSAKIDDYKLNIENNDYNLKDVKDIEAVLKRTASILSTRVSTNVNRFSSMTYGEEELQGLYESLENMSKNRGKAKEIIELGSRIETVETEKQKQFISQDEIEKTIEDIKSIISTLSKIQSILENNQKD